MAGIPIDIKLVYFINAFKIGEKITDPLQLYLSDVNTVPINLAGMWIYWKTASLVTVFSLGCISLTIGFAVVVAHP